MMSWKVSQVVACLHGMLLVDFEGSLPLCSTQLLFFVKVELEKKIQGGSKGETFRPSLQLTLIPVPETLQ